MNWQLPNLLAQSPDLEDLRKRVEATTQQGTTVPDSSLVREGTSNPFATEYWFPEQASSFAGEVDYLYMAIFWVSLVFFVAIVFAMAYFCVKYRRKGNVIAPEPSSSHNTAIEILWSVLPAIILVWFFYVGADSFFNMRTSKEDAEEILVVAKQFDWMFTYPDGDSSTELHLVLDKPVLLKMYSDDVLHSMFVPAFRQKMDVVPGRYTYAYVEPTKLGIFRLSCNEYCGTGHSKMRTMVQVHLSEEDRKANTEWIVPEYKPWENGQHIFQMQCSGCHRVDGERATGPALNAVWGTEEELEGNRTVTVNENYILDSMNKPAKDIVKSFGPTTKMSSFKGILNPRDMNFIIEYLKYLKDPTLVSDKTVGELEAEENKKDEVESGAADVTEPDKATEAGADKTTSPDKNPETGAEKTTEPSKTPEETKKPDPAKESDPPKTEETGGGD